MKDAFKVHFMSEVGVDYRSKAKYPSLSQNDDTPQMKEYWIIRAKQIKKHNTISIIGRCILLPIWTLIVLGGGFWLLGLIGSYVVGITATLYGVGMAMSLFVGYAFIWESLGMRH